MDAVQPSNLAVDPDNQTSHNLPTPEKLLHYSKGTTACAMAKNTAQQQTCTRVMRQGEEMGGGGISSREKSKRHVRNTPNKVASRRQF
jgi:hypothetical protein